MKDISNGPIKVVFMGTPDFALAPLASLIGSDFISVKAVVTQEDKPVGRKQVLTSPPVKEIADQFSIPVLQPKRFKDNDEFLEELAEYSPDFIVVVAYGQILPQEILDMAPFGAINIHGSLLPKYRGASPIEEALINGDTETGITFMMMNEELDSGDIILSERIPIEKSDTSETLRKKLSFAAAAHLPFILNDITEEVINPLPQDDSKATYCHKIKKEDGKIDLTEMTAEEILNKIRAYAIWPQCYLVIDNKRLKILEAQIQQSSSCTPPASYTKIDNDKIGLCTKKGLLLPTKVQLEGKNITTIQDFLKGNEELFKKLPAKAK
ncbi:methionyl-tRNA formyltransferase [Pseudomonadota bacterium]